MKLDSTQPSTAHGRVPTTRAWPSGRRDRRTWFQRAVWLAMGLVGFLPTASLAQPGASNPVPFRVGFASSMFAEVNEDDARAAVKGWGQAVARTRGIPTDPEPSIFRDLASLRQALVAQRVDAVGITALDYAALCREVQFAPIFITYAGG